MTIVLELDTELRRVTSLRLSGTLKKATPFTALLGPRIPHLVLACTIPEEELLGTMVPNRCLLCGLL